MIHMNARSLTSNIDIIKPILEDSNIGVATISETWLNDMIPNNFVDINGFKLLRSDRTTCRDTIQNPKRGGGLAIYLSNDINNYIKRIDLNICNKDIESQWLELHLPGQKTYFIGNFYCPPNGIIKNALENLEECLVTIKGEGNSEIFCMGDFNIDLLKPSKGRKELYDLLSNFGMQQVIKKCI